MAFLKQRKTRKIEESNMILSVLINYTNPEPSDHRKPTKNKPKHKEDRARIENFRILHLLRICRFFDLLPFAQKRKVLRLLRICRFFDFLFFGGTKKKVPYRSRRRLRAPHRGMENKAFIKKIRS